MFLVVAFCLGIMYQVMLFGDTHHVSTLTNDTRSTTGAASREDASITTHTMPHNRRAPVWGMMTLWHHGDAIDLNPLLLQQGNPMDVSTQVTSRNHLDQFKTSTWSVQSETVTSDPAATKVSIKALGFQILGTKFIRKISKNDREVPEVVIDNSQRKEVGSSQFHQHRSAQPTGFIESGFGNASQPAERESLVSSRFSWMDVVITIACTLAILFVFMNLVVCVRYVRKTRKRSSLYDPPPPTAHTYCLRIDTLRHANTLSHGIYSVTSTNNRDKLHCGRTSSCGNSPRCTSVSSGKISASHVSDAATQYESMDAMLASYICSDLIVELNDRDSPCTSVSDGFTFTHDYPNTWASEMGDGLTQF